MENEVFKMKKIEFYRFDPDKDYSKYSEKLILCNGWIKKVIEQKLFITKNV